MRLSSLMSKAGRQKVLTLFSLYLTDLWTHKSLRCVRVQEYDCSSTWTYHSITRYFSPPPTVYARGTLLPFFPSLFFSSRSSLPTSLSMVYRFILSLSLFHLHAHHIHLTFSPLLYLPYFFFFYLLHPSAPPPNSTLPLACSPYIQKPHGGSASNLNMLGSPFVLLVQGPHNAVSSARDPLSADLIR